MVRDREGYERGAKGEEEGEGVARLAFLGPGEFEVPDVGEGGGDVGGKGVGAGVAEVGDLEGGDGWVGGLEEPLEDEIRVAWAAPDADVVEPEGQGKDWTAVEDAVMDGKGAKIYPEKGLFSACSELSGANGLGTYSSDSDGAADSHRSPSSIPA